MGTRSFDADGSQVVKMAGGQLAHRDHVDQLAVVQRRLYAVRPGVWCLVGNGLSNQTFIDGPEGIIAVDTGESVEEMTEALAELRQVTDRPLAAVVYTHFHYVAGTTAVIDAAGRNIPVYGHTRIAANRERTSTEIAPAYSRGLMQQFGINLPSDGPDGSTHAGIGPFFRNPAHAPFTDGYVPVTDAFDRTSTWVVGGLRMDVTPAPSDADDSVTLWFPELGVAVNNIVWPALFNVFAIRGEEYRDPRVLLTGIDDVRRPRGRAPRRGARAAVERSCGDPAPRHPVYRDAIQFLWDQTVRGINRGWTPDELAERVRLPGAL